jgi:hypothetical protein
MNYLQLRRTNVLNKLKVDSLDGLLVTGPSNVEYLTGFGGGDSYFILTAKHAILVSDSRYEEQIKEECPGLEAVIRPHNRTTPDMTAEVLNKLAIKPIGIEAAHLSVELRDQMRAKTAAQLREGAGREIDVVGARALGGGFLSSLVHDMAIVHGMLGHLDVQLPAEADHGAIFNEGRGVQLAFGLPGGGRVSMTHINLAGVPDYTERVTVYCTDRIVELTFPSPYLRHLPTRLTVRRRGDGHALETSEHRVSYEEAFREELRAFHAAATGETLVHTTVEQARADVALLTSAFKKAIG